MDTQLISLIVPQSFENYPEEVVNVLVSVHGSYEKAKAEWKNKYSQLQIEQIGKQSNDMKEAI